MRHAQSINVRQQQALVVPQTFGDLATFEGDFNADDLTPGAITAWLNGGTFGQSLTGTGTVIADDVQGHNSVSLNGTTDALVGGATIKVSDLMMTQVISLFLVCFIPSIGGVDSATPYLDPAIISGASEYQGLHFRSTGNQFLSYVFDNAARVANSPAIPTTPLGRWILLQQRLKTGTLYGRVEDGTEASVACGGIGDTNGPIRFGVNYTDQYQPCKIARALFSKTALSDSVVAAVRARLHLLYGVAV